MGRMASDALGAERVDVRQMSLFGYPEFGLGSQPTFTTGNPMATYKLFLLPGDGIGPEVMAEAEKVAALISTREGGVALRDREGPGRRLRL